jgi:hypothetical protein
MLFNSPVNIFLFQPITVLGYFILSIKNSGYRSFWLVATTLPFFGFLEPGLSLDHRRIIVGSLLSYFTFAGQSGGSSQLLKINGLMHENYEVGRELEFPGSALPLLLFLECRVFRGTS